MWEILEESKVQNLTWKFCQKSIWYVVSTHIYGIPNLFRTLIHHQRYIKQFSVEILTLFMFTSRISLVVALKISSDSNNFIFFPHRERIGWLRGWFRDDPTTKIYATHLFYNPLKAGRPVDKIGRKLKWIIS